jgi:pimeloyl-ACP methyl ester carboxylesterase
MSGERMVRANGVDLCVETFGDNADPAILLIHGAAASMLWWDAELCWRIASSGRYVIRFDNRDTGRSVHYPPGEPRYAMTDLARDAVGILDALAVDRAHVVGCSMFGGMALVLGLDHADRVASLTFLSTSTGDPGLPAPTVAHVPEDPDLIEYLVALSRAYSGGSPYFDEAATRRLIQQDVARTHDMQATMTNHYAMYIDGPVNGSYSDLAVPSLVVHGENDPVFPLPHAEALRDAIPGATLVVLEQTGHELPPPVWDVFVDALVEHTAGR